MAIKLFSKSKAALFALPVMALGLGFSTTHDVNADEIPFQLGNGTQAWAEYYGDVNDGWYGGGGYAMGFPNASSTHISFDGYTDNVLHTSDGIRYHMTGKINYKLTPNENDVTIRIESYDVTVTGRRLVSYGVSGIDTDLFFLYKDRNGDTGDRYTPHGARAWLFGTYNFGNVPSSTLENELTSNHYDIDDIVVNVPYNQSIDLGQLVGIRTYWNANNWYNDDFDNLGAVVRFRIGQKVEKEAKLNVHHINLETGKSMKDEQLPAKKGVAGNLATFTVPNRVSEFNENIDGANRPFKYDSGSQDVTVKYGETGDAYVYYWPPHLVKWQAYNDETNKDLGSPMDKGVHYAGDMVYADGKNAADHNGWADGLNAFLGDGKAGSVLLTDDGTYSSPEVQGLDGFKMYSKDWKVQGARNVVGAPIQTVRIPYCPPHSLTKEYYDIDTGKLLLSSKVRKNLFRTKSYKADNKTTEVISKDEHPENDNVIGEDKRAEPRGTIDNQRWYNVDGTRDRSWKQDKSNHTERWAYRTKWIVTKQDVLGEDFSGTSYKEGDPVVDARGNKSQLPPTIVWNKSTVENPGSDTKYTSPNGHYYWAEFGASNLRLQHVLNPKFHNPYYETQKQYTTYNKHSEGEGVGKGLSYVAEVTKDTVLTNYYYPTYQIENTHKDKLEETEILRTLDQENDPNANKKPSTKLFDDEKEAAYWDDTNEAAHTGETIREKYRKDNTDVPDDVLTKKVEISEPEVVDPDKEITEDDLIDKPVNNRVGNVVVNFIDSETNSSLGSIETEVGIGKYVIIDQQDKAMGVAYGDKYVKFANQTYYYNVPKFTSDKTVPRKGMTVNVVCERIKNAQVNVTWRDTLNNSTLVVASVTRPVASNENIAGNKKASSGIYNDVEYKFNNQKYYYAYNASSFTVSRDGNDLTINATPATQANFTIKVIDSSDNAVLGTWTGDQNVGEHVKTSAANKISSCNWLGQNIKFSNQTYYYNIPASDTVVSRDGNVVTIKATRITTAQAKIVVVDNTDNATLGTWETSRNIGDKVGSDGALNRASSANWFNQNKAFSNQKYYYNVEAMNQYTLGRDGLTVTRKANRITEANVTIVWKEGSTERARRTVSRPIDNAGGVTGRTKYKCGEYYGDSPNFNDQKYYYNYSNATVNNTRDGVTVNVALTRYSSEANVTIVWKDGGTELARRTVSRPIDNAGGVTGRTKYTCGEYYGNSPNFSNQTYYYNYPTATVNNTRDGVTVTVACSKYQTTNTIKVRFNGDGTCWREETHSGPIGGKADKAGAGDRGSNANYTYYLANDWYGDVKRDVITYNVNLSRRDNWKHYTVQSGDSWWSMAQKLLGNGSRYNELASWNGMTSSSTIHPGMSIKYK
jgi:hypothetical protein